MVDFPWRVVRLPEGKSDNNDNTDNDSNGDSDDGDDDNSVVPCFFLFCFVEKCLP